MLELEDAQKRILAEIHSLPVETVPLSTAVDRFLRESIGSPIDLPPFDNSAMDGYAVLASDVASATVDSPVSLHVKGRIAAGENSPVTVESGSCVRIFTGSPLSTGADAVVMQEDTRVDESDPQKIWVTDAVKPWENIRFRGEDVKAGSSVVSAGERLSVGKLSLLAALGISEVRVSKRPIVGLLATGSELIESGQRLAPGKIYESNRVGLSVMVARTGSIPRIYPIVGDTLEQTTEGLRNAFAECDCVVTSGGVSVGEFDFVKAAFEKLGGKLGFWKVAIRPGKPFVFGQWQNKFLFGVPGNPVSALVTLFLLVRPALLKFQSAKNTTPRSSCGTLLEAVSNPGERRHFVRVAIDSEGNVRPAGIQASHILSGLAGADGLVDLPAKTNVQAGEKVRVLLWD